MVAPGLICTQGFRDTLFRDGFKPDRFNASCRTRTSSSIASCGSACRERVNRDGDVLVPAGRGRRAIGAPPTFREARVEGVAVALLWSVVNPAPTRAGSAEILREELPDVHVLCSSDVLPEIREWERTSATVLSAYVLPQIEPLPAPASSASVDRTRPRRHPAAVMQINGGCASVEEILQRPVTRWTPRRGAGGRAYRPRPTVAPTGRRRRSPPTSSRVDMGGTSFDVCLDPRRRARHVEEMKVEFQRRSASRASRCTPSAPAAAASPGSTPAARCRSGRRAPGPGRARVLRRRRRASPPSPMPTSSSATFTHGVPRRPAQRSREDLATAPWRQSRRRPSDSTDRRPRRGSSQSSTRTWSTRIRCRLGRARHRSPRASCSSRAAAPAACTRATRPAARRAPGADPREAAACTARSA